jgi:catechol 2,3-dioxygenase-like lactoylglutathione lyase family enzyme
VAAAWDGVYWLMAYALDCVRVPVPDLDSGLAFYRDRLGQVGVVADPFGNRLTLLDLSKGRYLTDADGIVTGVG